MTRIPGLVANLTLYGVDLSAWIMSAILWIVGLIVAHKIKQSSKED